MNKKKNAPAEEHYVEIKNNQTEESYTVLYDSYEALCNALDILFNSGGDFEVHYDLDEDRLTIDQFLNIMNKNPNVAKLKNPDNCKTIQEYRDWLEDYLDLLEIDEFLMS